MLDVSIWKLIADGAVVNENYVVAVLAGYIIVMFIVLSVTWARAVSKRANANWMHVKRITIFYYVFPGGVFMSCMPFFGQPIIVIMILLATMAELEMMQRVGDFMFRLWGTGLSISDGKRLQKLEKESIWFYVKVLAIGYVIGTVGQYLAYSYIA